MPLVLSCFSDKIMRPKSLRTIGMNKGAEAGLNTIGFRNQECNDLNRAKTCIRNIRNKVFWQSKARPLENLEV